MFIQLILDTVFESNFSYFLVGIFIEKAWLVQCLVLFNFLDWSTFTEQIHISSGETPLVERFFGLEFWFTGWGFESGFDLFFKLDSQTIFNENQFGHSVLISYIALKSFFHIIRIWWTIQGPSFRYYETFLKFSKKLFHWHQPCPGYIFVL